MKNICLIILVLFILNSANALYANDIVINKYTTDGNYEWYACLLNGGKVIDILNPAKNIFSIIGFKQVLFSVDDMGEEKGYNDELINQGVVFSSRYDIDGNIYTTGTDITVKYSFNGTIEWVYYNEGAYRSLVLDSDNNIVLVGDSYRITTVSYTHLRAHET